MKFRLDVKAEGRHSILLPTFGPYEQKIILLLKPYYDIMIHKNPYSHLICLKIQDFICYFYNFTSVTVHQMVKYTIDETTREPGNNLISTFSIETRNECRKAATSCSTPTWSPTENRLEPQTLKSSWTMHCSSGLIDTIQVRCFNSVTLKKIKKLYQMFSNLEFNPQLFICLNALFLTIKVSLTSRC